MATATRPDFNHYLAIARDDVRAYLTEVTTDAELVDALGEINSFERWVADLRRTRASEVQAGATGTRWAFKQGRQAKRSYNTGRLMSRLWAALEDYMNTQGHLLFQDVLRILVDEKVIRITWSWTNLQKLADKLNLSLMVAKHEIMDGDPELDVGEVWGWGSPSYEPVEE